ncbi:MAG: hypothetical protein Q4D76_11965 [Oscillospiraceae bacterium]|nr:hypothetical protein [Oscillospiraceae bacterium]
MSNNSVFIPKINAMVIAEGVLWGCLSNANALVRVSLENGLVDFVGQFPIEYKVDMFSDIVYNNGMLVFVPSSADSIVIYNISDNIFKAIPLNISLVSADNRIYQENYKFIKAYSFHDKVFIIPCSFPSILVLSMNDFSVRYLQAPVSEIEKNITEPNLYGYFNNTYIDNYIVYMGCNMSNFVLEFSLIDEKFNIVHHKVDAAGIWAVYPLKDGYLISSINSEFFLRNNDVCQKIDDLSGMIISDYFETLEYLYLIANNRLRTSVIIKICKNDASFSIIEFDGSIKKVYRSTKYNIALSNTGALICIESDGQLKSLPLLPSDTLKSAISFCPYIIDEQTVSLNTFLKEIVKYE